MATEKRLIRYDGLKQEIIDFKKILNPKNTDYATGYFSALSVVEGMMVQHIAEDAVEVVHGCWVDKHYKIACSVCENAVFIGTSDPLIRKEEKKNLKYCPNCGARMDGGSDG